MKQLTTLFVLLILFTSCKSKIREHSKMLKIDVGRLVNDYKKIENNQIEFIPLYIPDSIYFGAINHIKAYGEYVFLLDESQTNSLTITNRKGEYINQLKKIGNGPGEYESLDAFSYDESKGILSIYDRSRLSIYHYSFPDLEPLGNFLINRYIMNMEYVDSETIMIISENELDQKGKYEGVLYISNQGKTLKYDLPIGNDVSSIELSYPNTITKIADTIYYAHPYEITTIYKMNKKVEALFKIDFGKNKIPEKFWPANEASEFEQSLAEGNKAVWVQNLILSNEHLAFSFLYKEPSTRYFYQMNLEDSSENIYKGYKIPLTTYALPNPIGSDGKNYLSLIYQENIDYSQIKNNDFFEALKASETNGGYILAIYKP